MDLNKLLAASEWEWHVEPRDGMRVPAVIFGDAQLVAEMDDKVLEQLTNVAKLPGIVAAAYAMPDAHWGYGFPIGGVAAFDPDADGIISAGGVGYDISCGVRVLRTGLRREDIARVARDLADSLYRNIPAGVGSTGRLVLDPAQMDAMLTGGARWAVARGYGEGPDLERIEEHGCMAGADPGAISDRAKTRQRDEMGTLGSGNHYLEVQVVTDIHDPAAATAFGLAQEEVVISIHCGSRGLGHQIGTEYLREMATSAASYGIELPDLELACAPIHSPLGQRYLGAMRAAINCAFANRQILTALTRKIVRHFYPDAPIELLFDVSHNTCKEELHAVDGKARSLFVHRKGATRAFGPGHSDLPADIASVGQPVFIGGSMGTSSGIMAGNTTKPETAFSSACHGAGRRISRHEALRRWRGRQVVDDLAKAGIIVRSPSLRGVAEEAPGAYKDTDSVIDAAHRSGLARKAATLHPLICVKG